MSILEVKGVQYTYDNKKRVLKNINAQMEQGKVYAILGPSGCGKTTLLSLLGGLDSPSGGQILLLGQGPVSIEEFFAVPKNGTLETKNHLLCGWLKLLKLTVEDLQCYNNIGSPTVLRTKEVSIWIVIVYHIRNGIVSIILFLHRNLDVK